MLLTLLMNQSSVLNTITFIMMFALQLTAQTVTGQPVSSSGSYLIETAIANGSIGAILFIIWRITFKSTQTQFEFALKQNQDQFDTALRQIDAQSKAAIEQNQRTIDRLLEMMRKENESREVLAGILTRMESAITNNSKVRRYQDE